MNAKILVRVVSWRERNRPVAWIAREEGLDTKDVRAVLRIAGDPDWKKTEVQLDRYDRMEYFYQQGTPPTEIAMTLGSDYRTVVKWFPESRREKEEEDHD